MLDPSAIVTKLLEGVVKQVGGGALSAALGGAKKLAEALRLNFSDYLYSTIDRTSHVKTLLHRDERVDLYSIYIETFLKSGAYDIKDDKLVELVRRSDRIFVLGSAGSGKTMFIRYLFLQMVEGNFGVVPLFIELRNFNDFCKSNPSTNKESLIEFIYNSVVRPGAVVTKTQFTECLRDNWFTLILDGLDEVEHGLRPTVEHQIMNFREAYPGTGIVITSRPDERLSGWPDFSIYHIQPMKKRQVKKLVAKLPYNSVIRSRFIREVNDYLYERHTSFLSNPLLATMMLMTYDQFAHIPDKIHIFYEQLLTDGQHRRSVPQADALGS